MQGCRTLLVLLCVPLLAFPLTFAAAGKSIKLMKVATSKLQPSWCRNLLSTVVSTCVLCVTLSLTWLPGVRLVEASELTKAELGLPDLALLLFYIVLAFLASNAILPPRDSDLEHRPRSSIQTASLCGNRA
eukprot:TRINITY_DN103069_c0_g1_i1.p1 TRINITY_DN103069_c0_g1~~TRINITY_DN103069_c0_g1_i1.p1  ORF type:complete len:140 (-),score=2.73 TRINITY_DN103069_c0_g1_i1:104-496(-)